LVGILAPQFIQYIEKSRASKDEKMVSEVQNAIQVALADETVYAGLADTTITFTAAKQTKIGWDALDTAVQKTISLA
jgi:type IV pilus assembly protein PilA